MSDRQKIIPFYETPVPDSEIILTKEKATLYPLHPDAENIDLKAEGYIEITQQWSPMRLLFDFQGELTSTDDRDEDYFHPSKDLNWLSELVKIETNTFSTTGLVYAVGRDGLDGEIEEKEISKGTDHKLDRVTFHLPNYSLITNDNANHNHPENDDFKERLAARFRIKIEADGWQITLTPHEDFERLDHEAFLSHKTVLNGTGEIRKADGSQFKVSQVRRLLEPLYYFLSFTCLEWTPPLLIVGSNNVTDKSWQLWSNYQIRRSFQGDLKSWIPTGGGFALSRAFQGFLDKWGSPIWKESLEIAITWLIETSRQSEDDRNDGAIAFAQIPLEMLAWMIFVDDQQVVDEDEFEKLSAASKLQLLLSHCKINFDVPESLETLLKLTQKTKYNTGPKIVTKIRNTIIHPSKKNRDVLREWNSKYGTKSRLAFIESRSLFEHYLTLVILFLIGYEGEYNNKLDLFGMIGFRTPWSSSAAEDSKS